MIEYFNWRGVARWSDLKVNDLIVTPSEGTLLVIRRLEDPLHPARCDWEMLSLDDNTLHVEYGWDNKSLRDLIGGGYFAKYGVWRDGKKVFPKR